MLFYEDDKLVLEQEKDQVRALGIIALLGCLSDTYGGEATFHFIERIRGQIDRGMYAILYERDSKDAMVKMPVAFVTWAMLSRPCEVLFEKRLRPLMPSELNSGKLPWVVDMCAPLGHVRELKQAFDGSVFKDHKQYFATKLRNGKWRRENFTNVSHKKEA